MLTLTLQGNPQIFKTFRVWHKLLPGTIYCRPATQTSMGGLNRLRFFAHATLRLGLTGIHAPWHVAHVHHYISSRHLLIGVSDRHGHCLPIFPAKQAFIGVYNKAKHRTHSQMHRCQTNWAGKSVGEPVQRTIERQSRMNVYVLESHEE